jgi:hypothetical protein
METPRLLLNAACSEFEAGLANSSGTLGRYLMAQAGNVVLGRFREPVRMYKAPPTRISQSEAHYPSARGTNCRLSNFRGGADL